MSAEFAGLGRILAGADVPGEWQRLLDAHLDRCVCIGVSIMTGGNQIGHALDLVRVAKERPGCPPVVFGGPHVNVLAEQTARHELVDVTLAGPGQNSLPAFVRACLDGTGWGGWERVPGLLADRGGQLVTGPANPPRTSMLGAYPWHLIEVADYVRDDPTVAPRTLNYVASQGCVYRCRFCYELTYQRKYSVMPAGPLAADIFALQDAYGLSGIKFYDADWFINLRRAMQFCDDLIAADRGLAWAASINPNDVLKARRAGLPLLQRFATSGGRRLLMGAESGNDRVLRDIVAKDLTRADLVDVATQIADHGLLGAYTFIVGFPGESDAEIDDTYQLVEQLRDLAPTPETRVHLFAPYPGTPLYEQAIAHGFRPPASLEEWSGFNYYTNMTPWTTPATTARASANTRLRLTPGPRAARGTPTRDREHSSAARERD